MISTLTGPDTTELPAADELEGRFARVPHPSPRTEEERARALTDLHFGSTFTDHMAFARWTLPGGWGEREVRPYGPLQLDPATSALHYGQEVFEGLKAYRHEDGSVWTFRPGFNGQRLAASARRLALPELPVEDFVASLVDLVRADAAWVPGIPGSSLYLRPFMFSSEPFLGVRSGHRVDYLVIASPSGPYFTRGFLPIDVWVDTEYSRAGRGGTGAAKTAGNYAASLLPREIVKERGFEEVCFLDSATSTNIDELGGMNVFLVRDDGTVMTPKLTGNILEGGTRAALLALLADEGRAAQETTLPIAQVIADIEAGRVVEMFACGTAAVVTPIGRLAGEGFDVTVADGGPGPVTTHLYETLTDIQYGRREDPHHWMYRLA